MNVYLIAAQTADGYIGRSKSDRSFDWTSKEDKQFYVETIKTADVIVMGRETFNTVRNFPKGARYYIYTRDLNSVKNPKPEIIEVTPTNLSPTALIEEFKSKGYENIAISGGASIYSQFLKAGVVSTIYLTIEPIVFGHGISLLNEPNEHHLTLVSTRQLSPQTLLLEYTVNR